MKYYHLTLVGYDLIQHMPATCNVLHDMHPDVHSAAQAAYDAAALEIVDLARRGLPIPMPYSFSLNFSKGQAPACIPACIMMVREDGNVYTYSEYQVHKVKDLHLDTKDADTEWEYRGFIIKRDKNAEWYDASLINEENEGEYNMSGHSLRAVLEQIDCLLTELMGRDPRCDLLKEVK